jgi:hypothetical protein
MPVYVFLLGQSRAVPRNWFEVELNPRKIDWFTNGSNYKTLATAAVDESGGHGFITEYAGPSDFMKNMLYRPGQWNLDALATITDPGAFMMALLQQGFPRDQTMLNLLRVHIPLPDALKAQGVTEQQFYNALAVQAGAYQAELAKQKFDPAAFVKDLNERIVMPLQSAQALFDTQPYLTRLFSTVSPDEMTRDPLFQFNADLKSVSNNHRALATATCTSDGSFKDVTLVFENGDMMDIPGLVRPYGGLPWTYAASEPAAFRIALQGTSGVPARFYSRAQAKVADDLLNKEPPEAVRGRNLADLPAPMPTRTTAPASSGGCTVGGAGGGAAAAFLVIGLAMGMVRRRHARRG